MGTGRNLRRQPATCHRAWIGYFHVVSAVIVIAFTNIQGSKSEQIANGAPTAFAKRPTSPIEFLQNLKLAFDQGLLLQDDFIAEENLKQFFGAARVKWYWKKPSRIWAMVSPLYDNKGAPAYASINMIRQDRENKENEHGRPSAGAGGQLRDEKFSVDGVLRIFGNPKELIDPYIKNIHPTPIMRKTHELGNMKLIYVNDTQHVTNTMAFLTNGDGTIGRYQLIEEQK